MGKWAKEMRKRLTQEKQQLGNKDIKHMKSAQPTALLGRTGHRSTGLCFGRGWGWGGWWWDHLYSHLKNTQF